MSQARKVAVIGGGKAGIISAWAFRRAFPYPSSVSLFEQGAQLGGIWAYKDRVSGEKSAIHGNLTTNLPFEVMQIPSYRKYPSTYSPEMGSFLRRDVVHQYLEDAAQGLGIMDSVKLERKVIGVKRGPDDHGGWQVTTQCQKSREVESGWYDSVVVCNGHHSARMVPASLQTLFPQLGSSPRFIHSSEYDSSSPFIGAKNVLLVGTGASGADLCLELSKVAEKVTVAARKSSPFWKLSTAKNVEFIEPEHLSEASVSAFDAAVFATGFKVDFPFLSDPALSDSSRLALHVFPPGVEGRGLYFIGLPQKIPPAPLFFIQSVLAAEVAAGRVKIPEYLWGSSDPNHFFPVRRSPLVEGGAGGNPKTYHTDDGSRNLHEMGPRLREYAGLMLDLLKEVRPEEAEWMRNQFGLLLELLLSVHERRAETGMGEYPSYRDWKLNLKWDASGIAEVEWLPLKSEEGQCRTHSA